MELGKAAVWCETYSLTDDDGEIVRRYELMRATHTITIYLAMGLLLPVWDKLPDEHVQVCRVTTDDGQSFPGRLVPAPIVPELAAAFGIAAAETSPHVLATGKTSAIGAYRLKSSLVAGQQRLELLDWPHTRLAELKAAGCFTEIIQHKTRLFVPVGSPRPSSTVSPPDAAWAPSPPRQREGREPSA